MGLFCTLPGVVGGVAMLVRSVRVGRWKAVWNVFSVKEMLERASMLLLCFSSAACVVMLALERYAVERYAVMALCCVMVLCLP